MEIKILQVFLGVDGLPYKDQERTVHFPIVGSGFQGASNTTKIRFYYDELVEQDDTETAWVACAKLPNGKIGSKVLETDYDSTLGEHYALLELDSFYFQYKGDVYISLQGYQGGVQVDYDEETELYTIYGTPTIAATGSIKLSVNYATQFVGSGETSNVNFQRILADLGTKLGIRAQSEHVEELPSVGQNDIFYVVNDDPNDPNLQNIYIWNENTQSYVWVGDNTLYLGDYYTQEQGEQFEGDIDNRVTSVENQLQSVASGGPRGVYATLADLQTAYPTGADGIYVVSADGHWYYWSGSAWTDGGVYQSAVGVVPETRKVSNTSLSSDISPEELSNNLLPFNELLQFIPGFNKSTATTQSGFNDIAKNIVLIKGFTYTATWTFNQSLVAGGYAYLVDENGVNQFTGGTRIEAGAASLQVTITPTETKPNLTARVYISSQDIGKICTFEMTSDNDNKIEEIDNIINSLKPSSFQNYKCMMSFGIGDISNGVFRPYVYPYRISNDVRYTFNTDVIIKVDDGFRVGYCSYETMEQATTDQWSGWKTGTFTIPANTKFQLQCAKSSNEDADGPITDAYDNPIYNALTIKVKTEYEQSIVFEYGHNGLKIELFSNNMLWSQGACLIDNLIVGFNASNDDHTNTATYRSFFFENGYELNTLANHNLGHCASADYNKETDTMLVANGTYAASVTPTIYLISNAKNTVANGEDILVTNNNVISIELNNSLGEGVVACFGENSNIVYAMLTEDASNFDTKSKKYLYKLFLGKGSINMVSLYPTKSFGTFISGKTANEYNGTAYIMNIYEGDYYIELQGMKFLNGRVIISCDTYENNTDLTAYLVSLKINENNNTFEIEKCLYVPSLNDIGGYIRTESEDVVFDENYGYIVTYSSTTQVTKTLKFNINNL